MPFKTCYRESISLAISDWKGSLERGLSKLYMYTKYLESPNVYIAKIQFKLGENSTF